MLEKFDVGVFRWINGGWSNPVLDFMLPFFNGNRLFIPAVIFTAIFLVCKGGRKAWAFLACLAVALAVTDGVIVNGLKNAIGRPRPFLTLENVLLLTGKGSSGSMPSGHAANWGAAVAVTILFYRRSWRFMVPLGVTVGLARIYSGVHYPSDVVAGWGLGCMAGWAVVHLARWLWRRQISKWVPPYDQVWPELLRLPAKGGLPAGRRVAADWKRIGQGLILVTLLVRIIYLVAGVIELSEDEAYQWMWSKHPALSYFSKPPLIAYTQWAGRSLWGDNEFGVRFFSPICAALVSWMAFAWLVREGRAKLGVLLLVVVMATPILAVGATLMTIDAISVLFWTAAMAAGWQAVRRESTGWWAWTGAALALGFLSKYTGLFQLVSFAMVFALWPQARAQLRTPGPWLALAINLLGLVPVAVWNAQHGWITLDHLNSRAGLDHAWEPTLKFVADLTGAEFALLNPVFFAGLILAGVRCVQRWNETTALERYLFWMGAPLMAGYFVYSLRARVQPNWIAPAILPLFMWMLLVLSRQSDWAKWVRWGKGGLVAGLLAMIVLHDTRIIKRITGRALPAKFDPHSRVHGWKALADIVELERAKLTTADGKKAFVLADHYGFTSLLTFYIPSARIGAPEVREVYYPWTARPDNQYYFWKSYSNRVGNDAIYVRQVRERGAVPADISQQFVSVEDLGLREVTFNGVVVRLVQLFACHTLKPQDDWE